MSQQQHTQEPWRANDAQADIDGPNGDPVAVCYCNNESGDDAKANARRIVACVNACAGIDTELLEIIADNDKTLAGVIAELEKQRDTMLAALESISKITYDAGFNIGGPLEHCQGDIDQDEAKRLLSLACEYLKDTSKAAHRAIASVKGEEV